MTRLIARLRASGWADALTAAAFLAAWALIMLPIVLVGVNR